MFCKFVLRNLRKMYYEEEYRNKLGLTEYREVILDNISRLIINEQHIIENQDAYEAIIFKTYEKYANSKTENYTINQVVNLLEIFLDSAIKYNMSTDLPEDKITIY